LLGREKESAKRGRTNRTASRRRFQVNSRVSWPKSGSGERKKKKGQDSAVSKKKRLHALTACDGKKAETEGQLRRMRGGEKQERNNLGAKIESRPAAARATQAEGNLQFSDSAKGKGSVSASSSSTSKKGSFLPTKSGGRKRKEEAGGELTHRRRDICCGEMPRSQKEGGIDPRERDHFECTKEKSKEEEVGDETFSIDRLYVLPFVKKTGRKARQEKRFSLRRER